MTRHRRLILPTAALAALLAVSACTQSASTAPQATPSSAPSAATGGGLPGGDFAKIQQCLQAAGLSLPTGSFAPPSGAFPSGRFPNGSFPSGSFAPPSGSFAPPGGLGGTFNDPKVQEALKACGISLPGGAPAPSN